MKTSGLLPNLLLGFSLALAPFAVAANEAKEVTPAPSAAGTNEHDRLVQEYMAERAQFVAARAQLNAKAKKARTDKDTKSLKEAQDAAAELERDFKTRTADLYRQIKAREDETKLRRPAGAKSAGS